ncbi:MAG: hypothetical protein M1822_007545 [Bathelium mastoideum]|nr:MAG: hypothetical protein M1822_007545 [Bathelium mastoideum]
MGSLKLGLNLPNKNKLGSSKPAPAKRKPIFGDDDVDDGNAPSALQSESNVEELDTFDSAIASEEAQVSSSLPFKSKTQPKKPPSKPPTTKHLPPTTSSTPSLSARRDQQTHEAASLALDPSIYDYDAAHDALSAQRRARSAATTAARSADAGPRYMSSIKAAATVRERDQLRARDRVLQREREAEGDAFGDKESFVTDAYRAQQAEVRRAEEEERRREEEARKGAREGLGGGMQGFYREMMKKGEMEEREAEEAVKKGVAEGIGGEEDEEEEVWEAQEKERLRMIREAGGEVMIDEEGQVADKRQLLSAGLNLAPSKKGVLLKPGEGERKSAAGAQAPMARGKGDAKRAMRERQSRMVEAQLEQAAKRAAEEEDEERKKMERAAKSRKTDGEVSDAKARYLQRKKEKEAAAAAGK